MPEGRQKAEIAVTRKTVVLLLARPVCAIIIRSMTLIKLAWMTKQNIIIERAAASESCKLSYARYTGAAGLSSQLREEIILAKDPTICS
eukprot:9222216-Pyramimonas_sp.AAC.1